MKIGLLIAGILAFAVSGCDLMEDDTSQCDAEELALIAVEDGSNGSPGDTDDTDSSEVDTGLEDREDCGKHGTGEHINVPPGQAKQE